MIHLSSGSDTMKAVKLQWHKEQYFDTVCVSFLLLEKSCKTANHVKWVIVQGASICKYTTIHSKEYSNTKKL